MCCFLVGYVYVSVLSTAYLVLKFQDVRRECRSRPVVHLDVRRLDVQREETRDLLASCHETKNSILALPAKRVREGNLSLSTQTGHPQEFPKDVTWSRFFWKVKAHPLLPDRLDGG